MQTARIEDSVPIESKIVSRSIAGAQSQVCLLYTSRCV